MLPPIISKDLRCPYCDVPMWAKRRAKTTRESDAPPFKCLQCEHTFFAVGHFGRRMGCPCGECFKVKQQALAAQAQLPWKSELYTALFDLARKEAIQFIHVLSKETLKKTSKSGEIPA
ncbi:hypothetical protein [Pseudomonas sp. HLT2-19-2]